MSMSAQQQAMGVSTSIALRALPKDMDRSVPGEREALGPRLMGLPSDGACPSWPCGVSLIGALWRMRGPSAFQGQAHQGPQVGLSQTCSANVSPPPRSDIGHGGGHHRGADRRGICRLVAAHPAQRIGGPVEEQPCKTQQCRRACTRHTGKWSASSSREQCA